MKAQQPDIYIKAVLSGETDGLKAILDKNIQALAPTSGDVINDLSSIVLGLGLVSKIVAQLESVRTFEGEGNWHAAIFQGKIDTQRIQFSDHLHINDLGLIDRIEIFLRPSSMAGTFYNRMTDLITQKQQKN